MLEYPQRPSTAASTVLGKTSRHSSALPPKSESGLLPLARPQACQSALKNLRSKINNSKGHAGTLSRPRTSCFYRVNQRSAQAYSSYYLQSSHTSKWLSNRRVTHEEVLIPRAIDISALPSLEKTKFYSKPTLPNSRSQTNDVLESEDTNRSFFYNKKRRQADFEFMEQELLAQEEIYNNGKCSSKGTLTALRKTAQMITCSIPVAPVSNETTIDSLLLSASTSQARIELNDEKKTRYPYTEELIKSQPNESASFNASSPVHKLTHDQNGNDKAKDKHHTTFLTGISKPTVPLEGMSKFIWTYQQAASLARPIHVDTQQVYHLSNRNTQLSIKDPTLHITSSVNLGAGSYNLSFASLRPLSRSQLDVHIPSFSHTAHHVVRHTSRLKVAYNTNESNDNYPIGPSLKQNVDEAPLMQASPIPVTILDFFAS